MLLFRFVIFVLRSRDMHSVTTIFGEIYQMQLRNTFAKFYRDRFRFGFKLIVHQMGNTSPNLKDTNASTYLVL